MQEGDRITPAQFEEVPHGSVVERPESGFAIRWYDMWLARGRPWSDLTLGAGPFEVLHVGEGEAESAAEYEQRVLTFVRGEAMSHGVWNSRVDREVERGLRVDDNPRVGGWVHVNDRDRMRMLPLGTLLQMGPGDTWARYAMYEKTPGGFEYLTGATDYGNLGVAWRIIEIPGRPRPPLEQAWATREEFRRTLWEVGLNLKESESWCPSFERVMGHLGINAEAVAEPPADEHSWPPVGHRLVSVGQVFAAPVGARFSTHGHGNWIKNADGTWLGEHSRRSWRDTYAHGAIGTMADAILTHQCRVLEPVGVPA